MKCFFLIDFFRSYPLANLSAIATHPAMGQVTATATASPAATAPVNAASAAYLLRFLQAITFCLWVLSEILDGKSFYSRSL